MYFFDCLLLAGIAVIILLILYFHEFQQPAEWTVVKVTLHSGTESAKLDKINYNFHKSDFDMWYVKLGVFGAKESISVLKIINLWMYCTVLYCTVLEKYSFHETVQYMHDIYHFHGFLGQGTHFWTINDVYVDVLYSTVQFWAIMYSKVQFSYISSIQALFMSFPWFFGSRNSFLNSKWR